MHVRGQIRAQAIATLAAGTSVPVFDSHTRDQRLPSIVVFTDDDELADDGRILGPSTNQIRELTVRLEIRTGGTNTQSAVDQAEAIEVSAAQALHADTVLLGLTEDFYVGAREAEHSDDGDRPITLSIVSYMARYRVDSASPDTRVE